MLPSGRLRWSTALVAAMALSAGLAACQGCRTPPAASAESDASAGSPTVRIVALSTVAGALEPCGCSKDQLGGIDHLGAYLASQASRAKGTLVVAAGPLFFEETKLDAQREAQDRMRAEAMAHSMRALGLVAWAPGHNDWADGAVALARLSETSGAAILAANLTGATAKAVSSVVREIGGVEVGIVGVSAPRDRAGKLPGEVIEIPTLDAVKHAIEEVTDQGARVIVLLAAMPRGEALRLADALPEISVLVVGKPYETGHLNDAPRSPQLIGSTLVVEAANRLQTVNVIDLYVLEDAKKARGPIRFADGENLAKSEELLNVSARIRDLEHRLNGWEGDPNVKPEDVAARRADLEKLRMERQRLEEQRAEPKGSFFRTSGIEIRNELGSDTRLVEVMREYYKRVNGHNKLAFADRKPPPVPEGQAGYVGTDACTACHDEERKVWDGTKHAKAYETLQKDFKEYNLDCVSCHVTGYGKPGGSTVTHVDKLTGVGCEECHGPGSLHVKNPEKKGLIVLEPDPQSCVTQCHHPPHVEKFDPVAKRKLILGPGHGMD